MIHFVLYGITHVVNELIVLYTIVKVKLYSLFLYWTKLNNRQLILNLILIGDNLQSIQKRVSKFDVIFN